jgi:Heparinase II/III-like protein/Heparinase II/III N-terminus
MGLFVASSTWPMWRQSERWRRVAGQGLEDEAVRQNAADGVNLEQATWYHHEVADMMLIAGLAGRSNGCEFSSAFWGRLERMLEFVASVMDVGGNVPAWGDSDDAVMVRFNPAEGFDAYASLLSTGAVLFKRQDFKAKAPVFDDKSRWLLGDTAAAEFAVLQVDCPSQPVRRVFPEGGYYVLGSDFGTSREVCIVADAGPLGYLSIAAHGHADALSFTLSIAGREFLVDPGTFAYHTDRSWREYFRGTAAHNTLRIDGQDQSVSGGNFLWTHHAHVNCELFESSGGRQCLTASHDGYGRLREPAMHRRRLVYEEVTRSMVVDDEVAGNGNHLIEMHWHLSEHCRVELRADHVWVEYGGVVMTLKWPAGSTARQARGQDAPPLGWISRRFDAKVPCTTIVVSQHVRGNWRGRTEIRVVLPTGNGQF